MTNQTQQYIQLELGLAQTEVAPYGIDLKLEGALHNTMRVADRGVKAIKSGAINARRSRQSKEGLAISKQEYLYPVRDAEGQPVIDQHGKPLKILMQFGTMFRVDKPYADALILNLSNQAEGLQRKIDKMREL